MAFVFDLSEPLPVADDDIPSLLGGKAAGINVMAAHLQLPVPPAIGVTTEACRAVLGGRWPDGLDDELRRHIARIGDRLGRRFGDVDRPLLLSVRSGAPVSMPGMMDTILNLGLNEATIAGLAHLTGDSAFADDCAARLTSLFTSVTGMQTVPSDPWDQLRAAVEAVFLSWNSERAQSYRRLEGIPDDLGTGVVVQAMVFGNTGPDSGTGVAFTRDPSTGAHQLTGEVLFDAQGEDVVAGTHLTAPIGVLDERLPRAGADLRRFANVLEHHYRDMCDIEFTIEQGTLWLLQTRVGKRSPRAALAMAVDMANDPDFPLRRDEAVRRVATLLAEPPMTTRHDDSAATLLTRGIGASPGIVTGQVVTDTEMAQELAAQNCAVLLVRPDTSPKDVPAIGRSAGVLTSRGGPVCHAAVVARGWGIPAVVGAQEVTIQADGLVVGGQHIDIRDELTIDGDTGAVYAGAVTVENVPLPEVAILTAWAEESGIPIPRPSAIGIINTLGADRDDLSDSPRPGSAVISDEALLTTLWVKSLATAEQLAEALAVPDEALGIAIDQQRTAGSIAPETSSGFLSLTDAAAAQADRDTATIRDKWGADDIGTALESFSELDQQVKSAVAAWQLRETDGGTAPNDHSDEAYDAAVLSRLAGLHADVVTWLEPWGERVAQIRRYLDRLRRANAAVTAGNHRYIASPRVDSYHSVWFELHEYLIRLAGRTREDEVAAGRA